MHWMTCFRMKQTGPPKVREAAVRAVARVKIYLIVMVSTHTSLFIESIKIFYMHYVNVLCYDIGIYVTGKLWKP